VSEQQHRHKSGFETRAIHAGYEPDPTTGAVIPPIHRRRRAICRSNTVIKHAYADLADHGR